VYEELRKGFPSRWVGWCLGFEERRDEGVSSVEILLV